MSMSLEKVLQLGRLRMGDTAGIKFLETCLRLTTNFLSAVRSVFKKIRSTKEPVQSVCADTDVKVVLQVRTGEAGEVAGDADNNSEKLTLIYWRISILKF